MGWRFSKRIRIFKGLSINFSKTGTSFTVGRRGATLNVRGDKVTANVGIPGTGISYRQRIDNLDEQEQLQQSQQSVIPEYDSNFNGAENRELKWKFLAFLCFIALLVVTYLYVNK